MISLFANYRISVEHNEYKIVRARSLLGPTSSLAILISSVTSENTVGWMKNPLSPTRPPPHCRVAPSFFPISIYPRILSNCARSILNCKEKTGSNESRKTRITPVVVTLQKVTLALPNRNGNTTSPAGRDNPSVPNGTQHSVQPQERGGSFLPP